jgi:hypothetical protein
VTGRHFGSLGNARFVVVVCALSALSRITSAQREEPRTEGTRPDIRAECTRARVAVEARTLSGADTAVLTQLYVVGRCSESAGATLPRLWETYVSTPPDAKVLSAMIGASSNTRDGRTAAMLMSIASNRGASPVMRQAALVVLAAYVRPSIRGLVDRSRVRGETLEVHYGDVTDVSVKNGATPTDADLEDRLARLLDDVSAEKGNVGLNRLARALRLAIAPTR